jgi:cell division protein FtsB
MPAGSTTYGSRTTRRQPQRRSSSTFQRVHVRAPISQIKWDRKFRALLLVVLALIGWIGVHGMLTLIHTRAQSQHELQLVSTLAAQNRRLRAEQAALSKPSTIMSDARSLGMIQADEQSYVVTGLPNR